VENLRTLILTSHSIQIGALIAAFATLAVILIVISIMLFRLKRKRDAAETHLQKISTLASGLVDEVKRLQTEHKKLERLRSYSVLELENRQSDLAKEIAEQETVLSRQRAEVAAAVQAANDDLQRVRKSLAETQEDVLLQEVGVYRFRHPLSDVLAYQNELAQIQTRIKEMVLKDGGAIQADSNWTVNGSAKEGRAMVREYSKLMLRAFNAEADNLVRWLKPYKLDAALDRLNKSAEIIERLGKTMHIRVSESYLALRTRELELTADFLQKRAEQKEAERAERERIREEQKAQREIEAERARLAKERQHHANALQALVDKGDHAGADRVRIQLTEIDRAIEDVDFRAANIRAGYVYVISNIGSFGERMIKLGLTRRLDPMDRVRELSDASVPFNFDVHVLHFSKDAVGIEREMHERLAASRVNLVNGRREFFRVTPFEVKACLSQFPGELIEFRETAEALEYRQTLRLQAATSSATTPLSATPVDERGKLAIINA
jgi:Domain of unknown function (DUF4041)/Meiotically up-regulated gene 113